MKFETVARWVAITILTIIFGLLLFMIYGAVGVLIAPLLIAIIDVSCGIGRKSPLFTKVKNKEERVLFSSCCGVEDGLADINGPDWSTLGLCPRCKEHCDFEENEEE